MIMNRSIAFALGGLLLSTALTSLPAQAGSPASTAALKVQIGDLDLSHSAGIATLYQRLRVAAKQVCGPGEVTGSHVSPRGWQECVNTAVENAVRQLDRPALTTYHQSHAGRGETERS
jgi:UrcA family protein